MTGIGHAIVVSGSPAATIDRRVVPAADFVVAADAGLQTAVGLGLRVDLVIGDFDSVAAEVLHDAEQRGVTIERHSPQKDETDLELAIDAAVRRGADRVTVIDGSVGRIDHFLAGMLLLAAPRFANLVIDAVVDGATVAVVTAMTIRELHGSHGDIISLLALGGTAHGVRTTGLHYALNGDELRSGSTRGVSNVFSAERATVAVAAGTLLAIRPTMGDRG